MSESEDERLEGTAAGNGKFLFEAGAKALEADGREGAVVTGGLAIFTYLSAGDGVEKLMVTTTGQTLSNRLGLVEFLKQWHTYEVDYVMGEIDE